MTKREQLLHILKKSRDTELAFLAALTQEDRAQQGSFESWSSKDYVAHANYWLDYFSTRIDTWARGEALEPGPQFDPANLAAYRQFEDRSWKEVESFAEAAHAKMEATIKNLDEEQLIGPSIDSPGQPLWQTTIGTLYSHKLMHYSEYYQDHEQRDEASRLWAEWAEEVAPLDESAEWQGGVHYNAACSLALAGDREGALAKLQTALAYRPSMISWSRKDTDLAILHDDPRYRELYAPGYWWEAIEAGPLAEALADQFLRTLSMLKLAIQTCPEDEWHEGETLYQRPVGLALHIAQSIDFYSTVKAGEGSGHALANINWEERDATRLPAKDAFLGYLEKAEERMAYFIATSDLEAEETQYRWTGSTLMSRAFFLLRHAQHHLADFAMELKHRGLHPPDWQ